MTAQQLYTDTFRLAEQDKAADVDVLLLEMVASQGIALHEADSLAEALRLDSIMLDSMRLDSIEREIKEIIIHLVFQI